MLIEENIASPRVAASTNSAKLSREPSPRTWFLVVMLVCATLAGAVGGAAITLWGATLGLANRNMMGVPYSSQLLKKVMLQEESATTEVVKKVSPSVVSIIISKDLSKLSGVTGQNPFPFDNFFDYGFPFNFFFNGQQPQQQPRTQPAPQGKQEIGGGTGFVVNQEKGLILTNRHVVDDTEAEYTVLTNDGRRFEAKVVARDPVNDMALVQVQDKSLPALVLGDSDSVSIGQTVIAIGNALGEYRNTVTKGVISGTARTVVAGDNRGSSESLEGVFQTDAAINPGNSGGPLVNLEGQVVGMNTAVSSQGQLIGFAIPANEAKRMIASYEKYGRIVRPYLGIRYTLITPDLAKANKLSVDYGALIVGGGQGSQNVAVMPGSPADKAGLVENDIVLEVNGSRVDPDHSLVKVLSRFDPGDSVTLTVMHKGAKKQVVVKLDEFKEQATK